MRAIAVFSIIIPAYNVAPYIVKCLESIRNQKFSDFEVIIVDDGSEDQTGIICDSYKQKDSRIQVIHQENKGQAAARNHALSMAKGEWVVFVDADDYVESEMLSLIYEQIKSDAYDLCVFNARKVDKAGRQIVTLLFSKENHTESIWKEEKKFEYVTQDFMKYHSGWEVCFRAFRLKLINRYHIQFVHTKEVFAEDYLFTFQYQLYAKNICYICNILYNYVERNDSTMGRLQNMTHEQKDELLERLNKWSEYALRYIRKAHLNYFRKNFYQIYFQLFHFHICFNLKDFSLEQINEGMNRIIDQRFKEHYLKRIRKNSKEFREEIEMRDWI